MFKLIICSFGRGGVRLDHGAVAFFLIDATKSIMRISEIFQNHTFFHLVFTYSLQLH